MRSAAESFAHFVDISANIETLTAQNAKIDLGKEYSINCVPVDMHQARLAFDHFSLTRQFVQLDSTMFFGRNHRWYLVEIAPELFKCGANLVFVQGRHGSLLDYLSLSILRIGCYPKHKCSGVLLVFAHEQILNLCA